MNLANHPAVYTRPVSFVTIIHQATKPCTGAMCRPSHLLDNSPTLEGDPGTITRDGSRTREAAQAVEADLALLIGLAVALAVFCCVSLASIRLIRCSSISCCPICLVVPCLIDLSRRKGRSSQSIYNMSSLHCRSEFLEKTDLGPKRETHFSFPGARRVQADDKQVGKALFLVSHRLKNLSPGAAA